MSPHVAWLQERSYIRNEGDPSWYNIGSILFQVYDIRVEKRHEPFSNHSPSILNNVPQSYGKGYEMF